MRKERALAFAIVSLGAIAAAACGSDAAIPPPLVTPRRAAPVLPDAPGPFAPSEMRLASTSKDASAGARIADVDGCEVCHEDAAAAWRKSAHAFASFGNPVYRLAVDRIRHDRGNAPSRFCGGCHDVALLVDGAMDAEIAPSDPRAHAGVSCRVCHGVTHASVVGNGSYTLDTSDIPIPRENDPESIARHRERVAPSALRTNELCVSCHRATLDEGTGNSHHLVGQDDATPWMRSAYAGSRAARVDLAVKPQNCRECHMPKVAADNDKGAKLGKMASHRFLGAHTYLGAMTRDTDAVERVRAFLRGAATIRIGAIIAADDTTRIDVVVKNERVGHRFPGGVLDAQDTWIELTVTDARGRLVAEAGRAHAVDAPDEGARDESAHVLTSYMADEHGVRLRTRETHEFATGVFNTTIAPLDAVVTSYELRMPANRDDAAFPLRAEAKLRHRSRDLVLADAACNATRTERGRAFGREGLKKVARALDACAEQPITDVDETSIELGRGGAPLAHDFREEYDYALGLSHVVQERLDEAARACDRALALATTDEERGVALALSADVLAQQGRHDEARERVARARVLVGDHPALARIEGEALASTWRWAEAAPFFANAAARSPLDDATWSRLAVVRGGALDSSGAYEAAVVGLRANPRDESLLRVQALSLVELGANESERGRAMDEYDRRHSPDDAPRIRAACSATVPGCADERLAVHTHLMRVP
jgi:tetratricopeptide (TPR) repeat protein